MSNQYAPDTLTTPGEVLADYLDSFAITPEHFWINLENQFQKDCKRF